MSRAAETLRSTPTATLGIVALCTALYVLQLLFDLQLQHLTMCPRSVIFLHEYYRIVTSTLFHGSLMHIGMNMMSTAAIGSLLEKRIGTLPFLFTVLLSVLVTGVLHIGVAFVASLFVYDQLMFQHSVGFSGVLFHLSVLESSLDDQRSRSLFGFVSVPSFLYPWVLLVVLQMFMPNLSFLGHLVGIVAGTMQLYGLFNWILVTDTDILREMEGWRGVKWLATHPGFVPAATGSEGTHDLASACRSVRRGGLTAWRWIGYMVEAIQVIVFGRGRSQNANIQLGLMSHSSHLHTAGDDDDEWNGLPSVEERDSPDQHLV